MRIRRIHVQERTLLLKEPYTIAYGAFERVGHAFVALETDLGLIGHGCAAPDPLVTGEELSNVASLLAEHLEPALLGKDPCRWRKHTEALRRGPLRAAPSARCAVEMALLDLVGKAAGLPLWQIMGGVRDRIKTAVTIGILEVDEAVRVAADRVRQGFSAVKLKGGLDASRDIDCVVRVRESLGPHVELRFDANQGYTVAEACRFLKATRRAGISVFEQPTAKDQPDLLGRLPRDDTLAVMADESLLTLRDAFAIARRGVADMFNIKVMKVGGPHEGLQVATIARASGLRAMVGSMDESALGIAAGLQVGLAHPAITLADLDGHLDLVDDPFAGIVTLRGGTLFGSHKPGLGTPNGLL